MIGSFRSKWCSSNPTPERVWSHVISVPVAGLKQQMVLLLSTCALRKASFSWLFSHVTLVPVAAMVQGQCPMFASVGAPVGEVSQRFTCLAALSIAYMIRGVAGFRLNAHRVSE